jgi:hypothetical protein
MCASNWNTQSYVSYVNMQQYEAISDCQSGLQILQKKRHFPSKGTE